MTGTSESSADGPRPSRELARAAPMLAAVLLLLEEEAVADARPCPLCGRGVANADDALGAADDTSAPTLQHQESCELDLALREAGLRNR